MTYTKAEILASIARNGLRQIGKNKWAGDQHEYTISKKGDGYTLRCQRTAPWPGLKVAMREALRPMFIESRGAMSA